MYKMRYFTIVILLAIFSPNLYSQNINKNNLVESVEFLASDQMCGREPGSGYDLKAATYIEKKLSEMGYVPLFGNSGVIEFQYKSMAEKDVNIKTYNVVMTLNAKKAGQNILIGAHYDHLGVSKYDKPFNGIKKGDIYNGANDNASGVATMLEIANSAKDYKNKIKHNLIFVAFGAEENMLDGSTHLSKMLKDSLVNVDFMINLEMTGSMDSSNVVMVLGEDTFDMDKYFGRVKNPDNLKIEKYKALENISDHLNFVLDCPVAVFATTDIKYYHHPKDDVELINFAGMEKLSNFVLDFLYIIASDNQLPISTNDIRSTLTPSFYKKFPHLK